jgi:hypothetical protein
MRKHLSSLAPLLAVLLVVSIACATVPVDRVALDALQLTTAAANAAMKTANTMYVAGQLPEATVRKMIVDYDRFVAYRDTAIAALGALAASGLVTQATVDTIMAPPTAQAALVTGAVAPGGAK